MSDPQIEITPNRTVRNLEDILECTLVEVLALFAPNTIKLSDLRRQEEINKIQRAKDKSDDEQAKKVIANFIKYCNEKINNEFIAYFEPYFEQPIKILLKDVHERI